MIIWLNPFKENNPTRPPKRANPANVITSKFALSFYGNELNLTYNYCNTALFVPPENPLTLWF